MADILLDLNLAGFDGDVNALENALAKMQKTLRWMLGNLNSNNVTSLNTNITTIKSEDETTRIDGSQIKMFDGDDNIRLVMGYNPDTRKYEFTMYDAADNPSLQLDEDGNAVFKGKVSGGSIEAETEINVSTSITIGEEIILMDGDDEGGRISIYESLSPSLSIYATQHRDIRLVTDGAIELAAGSGVKDGRRKPLLVGNDVNGTFASADGKTITVSNGQITSIR